MKFKKNYKFKRTLSNLEYDEIGEILFKGLNLSNICYSELSYFNGIYSNYNSNNFLCISTAHTEINKMLKMFIQNANSTIPT